MKTKMTPLHLAALKHKLNAAHLLVEANADLNAFNEERKRPIDLCGDNAPLRALLTPHCVSSSQANSTAPTPSKIRSREATSDSQIRPQIQTHLDTEMGSTEQNGGNQVLAAAKNLLSSTIDPVTAYEETIILACDKAEAEAQSLQEPPPNDYKMIKISIDEHQRIADQFLTVLNQVQRYRSQLKSNKANVNAMSNTIDQTESDLSTKLHKKRTSNEESNHKLADLTEEYKNLLLETEDTESEIEYLEAKLRDLRKYQEEITLKLVNTRIELNDLVQNSQQNNQNETDMAVRSESLQKTKTLIHSGDSKLAKLEKATDDRLLHTGIAAAEFLRKYRTFIISVSKQQEERAARMEQRVELEKESQQEIIDFQLKMNDTNIKGLISDYEMNYQRFLRRKDKIGQIIEKIQNEFDLVKQIVDEFGHELEPLA